jgi:hypothetical protein
LDKERRSGTIQKISESLKNHGTRCVHAANKREKVVYFLDIEYTPPLRARVVFDVFNPGLRTKNIFASVKFHRVLPRFNSENLKRCIVYG